MQQLHVQSLPIGQYFDTGDVFLTNRSTAATVRVHESSYWSVKAEQYISRVSFFLTFFPFLHTDTDTYKSDN